MQSGWKAFSMTLETSLTRLTYSIDVLTINARRSSILWLICSRMGILPTPIGMARSWAGPTGWSLRRGQPWRSYPAEPPDLRMSLLFMFTDAPLAGVRCCAQRPDRGGVDGGRPASTGLSSTAIAGGITAAPCDAVETLQRAYLPHRTRPSSCGREAGASLPNG